MRVNKRMIVILLAANFFLFACVYVVLPEGLNMAGETQAEGWSAVATNVETTPAGDLHIDVTIRNEMAEWSSMNAIAGKPAILKMDGSSTNCDTVFVGTGGHRLAPGFQTRGYLTGSKSDPQLQLLYVECKGAQAAAGATLTLDYEYFNGALDYYHQENGRGEGQMEIALDEIATDLTYPVYKPVEGLIQPADVKITAISDNIVTLQKVERTEDGMQFTWQNANPTEFALKTHIGNPPVIGADGIIYGVFQIMDLASVPITPAKGTAEWTTKAPVPADLTSPYILLSVESKNMRLYINYALDITGQ